MPTSSFGKALWIVALLLWTAGCGVGAREAVERARSRWQDATGLTRDLPTIVEHRGPFKCRGHLASGCWNDFTQTLTLDVDSGILEWLATHEWGHVLGALDGHPGMLMCHQRGCSSPLITRLDVETVCDGPMGPCDVEKPETGSVAINPLPVDRIGGMPSIAELRATALRLEDEFLDELCRLTFDQDAVNAKADRVKAADAAVRKAEFEARLATLCASRETR